MEKNKKKTEESKEKRRAQWAESETQRDEWNQPKQKQSEADEQRHGIHRKKIIVLAESRPLWDHPRTANPSSLRRP